MSNPVLSEILSLAQLGDMPRPTPLIRGVLNLNSLAWIAGPPGSYKTFMALDYALHVTTGCAYMGRPVTQGDVLYIAGEGTSGLFDRVQAWEAANKRIVTGTHWLPRALPVTTPDWAHLVDAARSLNVRMIILDTQARMAGGLDENSVPEMGQYITGLEELKQATGACVVSVHHSAKNGATLRGSSAVQGAADTVISVEARDGTVGVHNAKQKDMAQFPDYWVRPIDTQASCVLVETDKPNGWDTVPAKRGYGVKNAA